MLTPREITPKQYTFNISARICILLLFFRLFSFLTPLQVRQKTFTICEITNCGNRYRKQDSSYSKGIAHGHDGKENQHDDCSDYADKEGVQKTENQVAVKNEITALDKEQGVV